MKIFKIFSASILLGSCVFADINTQLISQEEAKEPGIILPIDDSELKQKWDFSYRVVIGDRSSIFEWVPKGEDSDKWSKMIQVQFIPLEKNQKINATDFASAFTDNIKKQFPNAQVNLSVKDADRIFLEWSLPTDTDKGKSQDELSEIISTPGGIYRVAYTEKGPSIDPDVKKLWTDRLSKAKVVDGRVEAKVQ